MIIEEFKAVLQGIEKMHAGKVNIKKIETKDEGVFVIETESNNLSITIAASNRKAYLGSRRSKPIKTQYKENIT